MDLKNYDETIYQDGAEKMSKLLIYAEDPEFYRCFITPKATFHPEGMSCDRVREFVKTSSNENIAGIVDGDFSDEFEHKNLFKIDYYSIENIVLIYHKAFAELNSSITAYIKTNFDYKYRLQISFDGDSHTLKTDSNRIDKAFDSYLMRKITLDSYVQYMDLKKVVQIYGNKKRKYISYQKTLPTFVKVEDLFTKEEFDRFFEKICSYTELDIPAIPNCEY